MRRRSASGVMSTSSIWSARRTTPSGIVSRCFTPVMRLHHVVDRLEVLDVEGRDHVEAPRRATARRPATASRGRSRGRSCGRARRPARRRDAAPAPPRRPSPRTRRRGTPCAAAARRSRSPSCSAVRARPCVSMKPTTTSVPRSWRRRPSLSIAKVLPTPGAAPRYKRSWPRAIRPVCPTPTETGVFRTSDGQ